MAQAQRTVVMPAPRFRRRGDASAAAKALADRMAGQAGATRWRDRPTAAYPIDLKRQGAAFVQRLALMKRFAFMLCAVFGIFTFVVGCRTTPAPKGEEGSAENPVVVTSLGSEYRWIRERFPGSKFVTGAGEVEGGTRRKYLHIVTIITADGVEKVLYFDITHLY